VETHRRLRGENDTLREDRLQRDRRIRELEEQVRDLNQRRQDVAKRLDDLIGHVARLEAQVDRGGSA
jgi:chromosome segregation ATPase